MAENIFAAAHFHDEEAARTWFEAALTAQDCPLHCPGCFGSGVANDFYPPVFKIPDELFVHSALQVSAAWTNKKATRRVARDPGSRIIIPLCDVYSDGANPTCR